jgi:biotin operon repressor
VAAVAAALDKLPRVNVAAPHRTVVAGLDGDVLVLLARTAEPLSGREIADKLGLRSHDGVRKSLERLVDQGIVVREDSRSAYMHVLNREHVGAAAVVALERMRTELWTRLRSTIEAWVVPAIHASVFGSAARGDGDERSDIDIFVVRREQAPEDQRVWDAQIDDLRARVEQWSGNVASIVEQDEETLGELLSRAEPPAVLLDVRRDGIDLAGMPVHRLLAALDGA